MDRSERRRLKNLGSRLHASRSRIDLRGGFAALADAQLSGWEETGNAWHGAFRLTPAMGARGLKLWRHATAEELADWVMQGCPDYNRERPIVAALGSIYQGYHLPLATPTDSRVKPMRLVTSQLGKTNDSVSHRLDLLINRQPGAWALCVAPLD